MKRGIRKMGACVCLLTALACAGCTSLEGPLPETSPKATNCTEQQDALYAVVAKEYVNLREAPSLDGARLAQIDVGERVLCLGFEGLFMHVKVEKSGQSGYVHGGYLKRVNEDASLKPLTIVPNDGGFYAYARMQTDLVALKAAYPEFLTLQTLGQTADQRDIVLCIVGNPAASHKVLITAAIHGREHMTALLVMKQIEQYLYAMKNGQFSDLNDVAFYVIPMLNPDGVTISQRGAAGLNDDNLRAQVTRILNNENVDASQWKSNANGVDLNRNFPVDWESLYSAGPSSIRYRGTSPLCEAETRAVSDLMEETDFDVTLSYHAMGSTLYWQYKQDETLLEKTRMLAQAVYEATGYPLATSSDEEDLEGGGLRDYALMHFDIPSITVEIGCTSTPLAAQEWAAIWQRNSGVFPALAAYALAVR